MSPTCPIVAPDVGDWREPFIGLLEPRPERLKRVIAILRCLISALITPLPPGGALSVARSAKSGLITESEKSTYHRIRLNRPALPKLEPP